MPRLVCVSSTHSTTQPRHDGASLNTALVCIYSNFSVISPSYYIFTIISFSFGIYIPVSSDPPLLTLSQHFSLLRLPFMFALWSIHPYLYPLLYYTHDIATQIKRRSICIYNGREEYCISASPPESQLAPLESKRRCVSVIVV